MYMFGILTATFLMIKIEVMVLMLIAILVEYITFDVISVLVSIILAIVIILGHVWTTYQAFQHIQDKTVDLDKVLETRAQKNGFLNNPFALGIMWRVINECKYLKKVATLQFKK